MNASCGMRHRAIFAHPLLALLLLVEELALAAGIAAIAFGGHVLAERRDRLARDHLAADRRLDRNLEQVARDEILEPLAPCARPRASAAARWTIIAERVDRLVVHQHAHLDEVALAIADLVIVEARIAAADRSSAGRRSRTPPRSAAARRYELGAAADIGEVLLDAAAVLAELQDRCRDIRRARRSVASIQGSSIRLDAAGIGHVGRDCGAPSRGCLRCRHAGGGCGR